MIGLFGISGVGKSHLAAIVTRDLPDVLHLEASRLLRRAHHQSGETLRTAAPTRLRSNQDALAGAVANERRGRERRPVLLDAHSVIDNDAGLVAIPYEAIAPLGIEHFFFLELDAAAISARRSASERPRPHRDAHELDRHQRTARTACANFAAAGRRPFTVLDASRDREAALQVEQAIRNLSPSMAAPDREAIERPTPLHGGAAVDRPSPDDP